MKLKVAGKQTYFYGGGRPFTPDRPVVLLIHGAGHDHSVWNFQARHLAHRHFAVAALDLPGHGQSEPPALESVPELAEWLVACMDALNVGSAALAGHSMGSLIALHAAARHPDRVNRLILIGSAVPMPVATPLLQAASDNRDMAHAMINRWSYASPQAGASASPGMWLPGANQRLMERQADTTLAIDLAACNDYTGGEEAAAAVRGPVLVISGGRDQMTSRRASKPLFDALSQSPAEVTARTIPEAGHAIMAEAPAMLNQLLSDFLSGAK